MSVFDSDITEKLRRAELCGVDFLWDPKIKTRSHDMIRKYGPDMPPSIIQYIFQGGARDLQEFMEGYKKQFEYRQSRGWPLPAPTAEEFTERVRQAVLPIALSDNFNFVYCPFMKTRLVNSIREGTVRGNEMLKDTMCYIFQGVELDEFRFREEHELDREKYLRNVGILRITDKI